MEPFQGFCQYLLERLIVLDPTISIRYFDKVAIIRSNASKLFRSMHSPMLVTIMSEEKVSGLLEADIRALKTKIMDYLGAEERIRICPLLIYDKDGSNIVSRVEKLLTFPFMVFSAKAIMRLQLSIPALRTYFTDYNQGAFIRDLNPYRTDIITPYTMFFGRDKTIEEIIRSPGNKYIIGARRIGKSSLAAMLKRKMGKTEIPKEMLTGIEPKLINRCAYVDVSKIGVTDSSKIWLLILEEFGLSRKDFFIGGRVLRFTTSRKEIYNAAHNEQNALEFLLSQMPSKSGLTIIFDEVDNWLYHDKLNNWEILNNLRHFADNNKVTIILVGYETLAILSEYDKFPLHSRGGMKNKILLTPINKPDAESLVFEPMAELGIKIENKTSFIDKIWHISGGMPHIIQDICQILVNQICEEKRGSRALNLRDLDKAISSSPAIRDLANSILDTSFFPLAKLIAGISSLYTKSPNNEDFEIIDKMSEIERALKNNPIFTISSIIERLGKFERFKFNEAEFNLALSALELRLILKPANLSRTQWYWNSLPVRKIVTEKIIGTTFVKWVESSLDLHNIGEWKKDYMELIYLK